MKTFIPLQLKGNIKPRDISHIRVSVNTHTRVLTTYSYGINNTLSSSFSNQDIRGRELMLSFYYKP